MHRASKGAPEQVKSDDHMLQVDSCARQHSMSSCPTSCHDVVDSLDSCFAPSQILQLAHNKAEISKRVHSIIDKFAERGLRSLAVARQVIELKAGS